MIDGVLTRNDPRSDFETDNDMQPFGVSTLVPGSSYFVLILRAEDVQRHLSEARTTRLPVSYVDLSVTPVFAPSIVKLTPQHPTTWPIEKRDIMF